MRGSVEGEGVRKREGRDGEREGRGEGRGGEREWEGARGRKHMLT